MIIMEVEEVERLHGARIIISHRTMAIITMETIVTVAGLYFFCYLYPDLLLFHAVVLNIQSVLS